MSDGRAGAARAVAGLTVTGVAQRRAWAESRMPPVERLPDGAWSLPVPMAGHPLRYTLSYLIEGSRGPVLIDPGWSDDAAWAALVDGLEQAGATPADVQGVLVTHAHSDHYGLAWRVREISGAWVGMHAADIALLRRMTDTSAMRRDRDSFAALAGAPPDGYRELAGNLAGWRPPPERLPDRAIADGDADLVPGRRLVAHWTPGHTPGHLCFVDDQANLAFTGDHLLPRITSHMGAYSVDSADVLGRYLGSLATMRYLDETTEIRPGHEYRFTGARSRIDGIGAHHRQRLDEVLGVVRDLGTATVWQVASAISWSRGWAATTGQRRRLALAETLAHLRHLEVLGEVARRHRDPIEWEPTVRRES